MGRLFPSEKEQNLYSDMMLEAGRMMGVPIKVKMAVDPNLNMYHDPDYEYSLPEELDILVDENPQVKVLRHLHWYNENDEVLPILAYFSKRNYRELNMEILMGAELEFPYQLSGVTKTKKYKVMDARAFGPGPMYWICKLAPVRIEFEQEKGEELDGNYNHLNITRE